MDTVFADLMDQAYTSSRRKLLTEFRDSRKVRSLIEHGMLERKAIRDAAARRGGTTTF